MWHGYCCQMSLSSSETADLLGFSNITILVFTKNCAKKRKYPMSGNSLGEYGLVTQRVTQIVTPYN